MRVAVRDALHLEQASSGFEFLQDQRIGFPDRFPRQWRDGQGGRIGQEFSIITNRIDDRQAIDLADLVVIRTMRRRGMDQAGARLQGDVRTADEGDVTLLEGMFE